MNSIETILQIHKMSYNESIQMEDVEQPKPQDDKQIIINRFNEKVRGKKFDKDVNNNHDGEEGHWLEELMDIKPNGNNAPDLLGYEQKQGSIKTTFIDKAPSDISFEGNEIKKGDTIKKKTLWNMFQRQNSGGVRIGGWKLDKWDNDGQCLCVNEENNINILYNYSYDKRENKNELVSQYYKNNESHIIISWNKKDMEKCIDNKWNQKGFFICKKNKFGIYDKICFGDKFGFDYFIEQVKEKNIEFDGYSKLGGRFRGVFRSSSKWFYTHIIEEY